MIDQHPSAARQAAWLVMFVALCLGSGAMGAALTATTVGGWYQTLNKPTFNPPDWIFGPVWTALYIMMAVAAWLVWRRDGWRAACVPLGFFLVQLALNVGWSGLFFYLRRPDWAFAGIVLLWAAIAATAASFWHRSRPAAWLLAPYLAWTTFAGVLNLAIWKLNP
jgi:tryptophan-rich sensory protein